MFAKETREMANWEVDLEKMKKKTQWFLKKPNGFSETQQNPTKPKKPDIDIDKDIDVDKDIDIDKNSKKENNKRKSFEDVFRENNFSEEFKQTLKDFIIMRKTIKKPMTTKALELLLRNLEKLTNLEAEKIEILNQSIEHGWQSVYPLKDKGLLNITSMKNDRVLDDTDLTPKEYSDLMTGKITTEELIQKGRIYVR